MTSRPPRLETLGSLAAVMCLATSMAVAQTVSPLKQNLQSDHWLMTTFELVDYSIPKIHQGVDVVGVPFDGPFPGDVVVVVEAGTICWSESIHWGDDNEEANLMLVSKINGVDHVFNYVHLDPEQVQPDFDPLLASRIGLISAGTEVSGLSPRDFYVPDRQPHLHFAFGPGDCDEDLSFVDPTPLLTPFVDVQAPGIEGFWICDDDFETSTPAGSETHTEWKRCESVSAWTCPSVFGHRDFIVKVEDRHHAQPGGHPFALGVRSMEWCARLLSEPSCDWQTTFDYSSGVPKSWTTQVKGPAVTKALYSALAPCQSSTMEDAFGNDELCVIATNGDLPSDPDSEPNRDSFADLSLVGSKYYVSVRATDFDGRVSMLSTLFCSKPGPVIRDCVVDRGLAGQKEFCATFDDGPDILFPEDLFELNPAAPAPVPNPLPIEAGTQVPVRVCMTARGPRGSVLEEPVEVRLSLQRTPPASARRGAGTGPGDKVLASRTLDPDELTLRDGRVPAGPWRPGAERCATLSLESAMRIATLESIDDLFVFVSVSTESNPLDAGLVIRADPQKAQRSLRRMLEDAGVSDTRRKPDR